MRFREVNMKNLRISFFIISAFIMSNFAEMNAQPSLPKDTTRLLIINNDGTGLFCCGRNNTPQELIQMIILNYKHTYVNNFEWCVNAGSNANYDSKVTDYLGKGIDKYPRTIDSNMCAAIKGFIDNHVDIITLLRKTCDLIGVKFFASFRMGPDYQTAKTGTDYSHLYNGKFWWEHQNEQVLNKNGSKLVQLSYAYPDVQRFKLDWISEVLNKKVDGINFDFLHHPPFLGYENIMIEGFKTKYNLDPRKLSADDPRWIEFKDSVMTDFMKQVRTAVEKESLLTGKKILISAKVDYSNYKEQGLDIDTWVKEGLIDILIIGKEGFGGYVFDLKPFAQLVRGTTCKLVVSEESALASADVTPEMEKILLNGGKIKSRVMSTDEFCKRAINWYAEGAEGIEIFNEATNTGLFDAIGNPERYLESKTKNN